jgi:2-C-methyl-D-erythritol 4-phosphate cytidylyltransferase
MKVYGVILGAGDGKRMGGSVPKQFMSICGKPVIAYTLEAFQIHKGIDHILVVTHADYIEKTREII